MWNSSAFAGGFGNNTSFGNKTMGGGGGFLNTGEFGSPGGNAQEKKKSERLNNVVPVAIGRVQQSPDTGEEHLKIGSMATHMITVVGLVRSVDEQSTRVTYFVDDMTGPPIEVQMWLGENEDFGEKRSSIMENTYIRVTGVLRSIKGKQLINAFKIVPVTDMNELTMHVLEVLHTSMAVAVLDNPNSDDMTMKTEIKSEVMDATYNSGGGNQNAGSFGGLNRNQQIVFQTIKSYDSEKGVGFDYLYSAIKSLSRQTIKDTVEFLSNEGHIYSTIDDDHFKTTDSVL